MESLELTSHQRQRYARNLSLSGIGEEGQFKLLNSKVLVVGCGALGCVASMQLAASGVGHVVLVDFDTVDLSNLQRQFTYGVEDLGCKKNAVLARKIQSLNPEVSVEVIDTLLRHDEAMKLMDGCDLVLECSDNPATKYMLTDAAREAAIPCVLGGVNEYSGQVQTFLESGVSYRDWWPEEPDSNEMLPCGVSGLLGPLPAMVASIQAAEAVKILVGTGDTLAGKMLMIDALTMRFRILDY